MLINMFAAARQTMTVLVGLRGSYVRSSLWQNCRIGCGWIQVPLLGQSIGVDADCGDSTREKERTRIVYNEPVRPILRELLVVVVHLWAIVFKSCMPTRSIALVFQPRHVERCGSPPLAYENRRNGHRVCLGKLPHRRADNPCLTVRQS